MQEPKIKRKSKEPFVQIKLPTAIPYAQIHKDLLRTSTIDNRLIYLLYPF